MEVTIAKDGNRIDAAVSGELNTDTADQFLEDIAPLMEGASGEITIDCSNLGYISSKGLRAFLILQKKINADGGSLTLTNMPGNVRTVFEISDFSSFINIK